MKKLICILFAAMSLMLVAAKKQPAVVILTAGQSNTDGRVMNTELPAEIQQQKYKYCQWSFGSSRLSGEGKFETFWPRINNKNKPGRWAYDAIVYWNVEKKLKKNFYVIKESSGRHSHRHPLHQHQQAILECFTRIPCQKRGFRQGRKEPAQGFHREYRCLHRQPAEPSARGIRHQIHALAPGRKRPPSGKELLSQPEADAHLYPHLSCRENRQ